MFMKCKTQSQKVEAIVIRKIAIEQTGPYGKHCGIELERFANGILFHTEDKDMYCDAFSELMKIDYAQDIKQVTRDLNTIFKEYGMPLLARIDTDRVLIPYLGEF